MSAPCVVSCYTCSRCVWAGGRATPDEILDLPFGNITHPDGTTTHLGDGLDLLTHYADAHCTRSDCPHLTAHRQAVPEPDVTTILAELRDRIARLEEGYTA